MLSVLKVGLETPEDTFHRIIAPMVMKTAESRLQILAEEYRKLTPDLQLEALQVLKDWKASKQL